MKLPEVSRATTGIAAAAVLILALSCSSGSDPSGGDSGGFPIVDQPLTGVIAGDAFTFVEGGAKAPDPGAGSDYSFRLYNKAHTDYFEMWEDGAYASPNISVEFKVPLAEGTYPLYNRYDGSEPFTATLCHRAGVTSFLFAAEGSIRIDSINTVSHTVSGAIAARGSADHDNWVNGIFTAEYQP
jgi:hypothetical protein